MIYQLLKPPARLFLKIACRNIKINKPELLYSKGPLLLACNHPNSFLDGMILAILFDMPVHSLARGDAFNKKWHARLLKMLHIHPVYREREGKELVPLNYKTFGICKEIFKNDGIVLIFSEALCVNEWKLRPLRKGTARMAFDNWNDNIPLKVLPVGINYSSFRSFGKNIIINFGEEITSNNFNLSESIGKNLILFNEILERELQKAVITINSSDIATIRKTFSTPVSIIKKLLLVIPALAGSIINRPLYWPVKSFVNQKAHNSGHYDSILVAALFLTYPIYLLLITAGALMITKSHWSWLLLLFSPFSAWCAIQLKKEV
ncbi:MAG TPA: 1-acyl-sn-glycerol-3-phosphate acyltransferase [Chitinophagaceae bacterium]|nr:1-acyl-sn-glycerol-3-phosphate acyltransferase [Chitinophagaceae bacterium]